MALFGESLWPALHAVPLLCTASPPSSLILVHQIPLDSFFFGTGASKGLSGHRSPSEKDNLHKRIMHGETLQAPLSRSRWTLVGFAPSVAHNDT